MWSGGLQSGVSLFPLNRVSISYGIALLIVNEKQYNAAGELIFSETDPRLGFFAGFGIEQRFSHSSFSVIAEAQYHHEPHISFDSQPSRTYGGFLVTIAGRVYLGSTNR